LIWIGAVACAPTWYQSNASSAMISTSAPAPAMKPPILA